VACGDGEFGAAQDAPFGRLTATVAAWDLPLAWLGQLAPGGRMVVPLRLRGLIRSVAFERADGHLVSRSAEPCGFVPMRGAGAYAEQVVRLDEGGSAVLKIDDPAPADADALRRAAAEPGPVAWTGVMMTAQESFCPLDLWLAGTGGFCRLSARPQPPGAGLARPALASGTSAVRGPAGFAYLTVRKAEPGWASCGTGQPVYEIGAAGYGPGGGDLATALAGEVRVWDRDWRAGPGPWVEAYPGPGRGQPAGRLVVRRRHCAFAVVYPRQAA